LKTYWRVNSPFVFISIDGLQYYGTLIYESFAKYTQALEECVATKMPDILRNHKEF
jgi:hypothetical protein